MPVTPPGSTVRLRRIRGRVEFDSRLRQYIATQQYVTWASPSGQPNIEGTSFLPSVVSPATAQLNSSEAINRFGLSSLPRKGYKYQFLLPTICEVIPLITSIRVDYTDGGIIINASQTTPSRTFAPNDTHLLFDLSTVANEHAQKSQGEFNTPISNNTEKVYRELEDYWRGAIEFAATFPRAAYSAEGALQGRTPSNMSSPVNGTMLMVTMGWVNRGPIYIFSILPLGIVTSTPHDDSGHSQLIQVVGRMP
ncbi:hypothetical protein PAXRUDRAFT_11731 [Paxillus rubicundulus Ve08.2h10]|uniref:Uncharacterized protein n=1 Tax=Paxillus rubicundulus Ve08.2h10 TaxID=930991 RepID=A0A0D0DQT4_9AGAM|nr:hypothetical protein PAXRUDRAFT_11731 [Paxillus rubicundulus Ve08.2h10]